MGYRESYRIHTVYTTRYNITQKMGSCTSKPDPSGEVLDAWWEEDLHCGDIDEEGVDGLRLPVDTSDAWVVISTAPHSSRNSDRHRGGAEEERYFSCEDLDFENASTSTIESTNIPQPITKQASRTLVVVNTLHDSTN